MYGGELRSHVKTVRALRWQHTLWISWRCHTNKYANILNKLVSKS